MKYSTTFYLLLRYVVDGQSEGRMLMKREREIEKERETKNQNDMNVAAPWLAQQPHNSLDNSFISAVNLHIISPSIVNLISTTKHN